MSHPQGSEQRPPERIVAPRIEVTKSPDYKAIYASSVFGGLDPNDARMIFMLERLEPTPVHGQPGALAIEKINQELQVEVHMSPHQFKSMAQWMTNAVQRHEQQFGVIQVAPAPTGEQRPPSGHVA